MLKTVKKDKEKISNTIETLDDIKGALEKDLETNKWRFWCHFADLLPGSFCKLCAEDNNTTNMTGLEIKSKTWWVWKESLTELSGGQRSPQL